jgi:predicted dehydrogenase
MIRIGIAGMGFMGWVHWLAYQRQRRVRVAAVCDRKPHRLAGDWRGVGGNFGPPGRKVDLAGAATYLSIDDLIRDPDVDVIDITLPTALHAEVAVQALAAGKHVICEKPMALSSADCAHMIAAARKSRSAALARQSKRRPAAAAPRKRSGKPGAARSVADPRLLVAHVLPFFAEYAWALSAVRSGRFGRLLGGSFKRVIRDPTWIEDYWSPGHIGGPMLDLHVHDAHFIRLLFGRPTSVTTKGRLRGGMPEYWHTLYQFDDRRLIVEAVGGVIDQTGRAFNHGFEIHLEHATLAFEFAVFDGSGRYLCKPLLLGKRGRARQPKLGDDDPIAAFTRELTLALDALRSGRDCELLDPELARDAVRICHAETASLLRGKSMRV